MIIYQSPILITQKKQSVEKSIKTKVSSVWVFNRACFFGCKASWYSKNVLVTLNDSVSAPCASQAVCCDDHIHCCPHGTVCNLEAETCDNTSGFSASLPWVAKVPALISKLQEEKCDQQTMCPGGNTCCKRNSGQWACCPLPQVSLRAFWSEDAGVLWSTICWGYVCSCTLSAVIELKVGSVISGICGS